VGFDWSSVQPGPRPDEVEVCVFGPGYGEGILVHLGDHRWAVVDSCIDKDTDVPAAISYLKSIGLDPAAAVDLIIATHWHDDHVRGLSRIVEACPKALFSCASALTKKEFATFAARYEARNPLQGGTGVTELWTILRILQGRDEPVRVAGPDRRLMTFPAGTLRHGMECNVWTLSPSDLEYQLFLERIAQLVPNFRETKRRAVSEGPNRVAAVSWIEWDKVAVLLGSDLEEDGNPDAGWSAILASTGKPVGKASLFKVAHHGSQNADHVGVWEHMLSAEPIAILTPWNRGRGLPQRADVTRILGRTETAFVTAPFVSGSKKVLGNAVRRTLDEASILIRAREGAMGAVRARYSANGWVIELFHHATHLRKLIAI
jgi:Metallo-beta-lactamase superfamily